MRFCLILIFSLALSFVFQPVKAADALCVKTKKANLRKGPGTQYDKLWQVFQYMPFKLLKKKGSWYHVQDVDGDKYWLHKKLVSADFKCAAVKKNKANLRSGPGTKHPTVPWSPVDKYFSMKVLKMKGKWVYVQDSVGDKAWIYKSLVWIQ